MPKVKNLNAQARARIAEKLQAEAARRRRFRVNTARALIALALILMAVLLALAALTAPPPRKASAMDLQTLRITPLPEPPTGGAVERPRPVWVDQCGKLPDYQGNPPGGEIVIICPRVFAPLIMN